MKILQNLDERLLHHDPQAREDEQNALPTFRRALAAIVGTAKSRSPQDSINITKLALKMRQEGNVELDDHEYVQLLKVVNQNDLQWPGFLHGQMIQYLEKNGK